MWYVYRWHDMLHSRISWYLISWENSIWKFKNPFKLITLFQNKVSLVFASVPFKNSDETRDLLCKVKIGPYDKQRQQMQIMGLWLHL